jgi:hypothetical protein
MRLASRLLGYAPERLLTADSFWPFNPSTWAVGGGTGQLYHMEGSNVFHAVIPITFDPNTGDYTFIVPGTEPQGAFYCLYGSCFLNHCYTNHLLRALIVGGTNFNLGAMWFRGDQYTDSVNRLQFEQTALGETVGSGLLRTMNGIIYDPNTYQAWIGDPTLRVQVWRRQQTWLRRRAVRMSI